MEEKNSCGTMLVGCLALPILGCLLLVCVGAIGAALGLKPETNNGATSTTAPNVPSQNKDSNQKKAVVEDIELPLLPGLAAADVHINFESEGFKTTKRLGGGESKWECTLQDGLNNYRVTAYGKRADAIWMVTASAHSAAPTPPFSEIQRFFAKVATIPYNGSNQARARAWAAANWQKDQAKTRIGKAEFEFLQGDRRVTLTICGVD